MNNKDIDIDYIGNINTAKIDINNESESSLFATNNLYKKTSANLAKAEAMVDEKPLRTEITETLEKKEVEERNIKSS